MNLLELKPKQLFPSETIDGRNIVVLVPKFKNKIAQRLLPKVSKSNFRVKLDEVGSFVWKNCEGMITVQDIADRLKVEFGQSVEPVYERVSEFIRRLHRGKLIDIGLIKEEKS